MDEKKLLRRAQKGDEAAFEELVKLYQKAVYAVCWRICRNEEDAMDAAQEAFLSAWRALPKVRGDAAFSTWLTRLATNASLDILRKKKHSAQEISVESAEENGGQLVSDEELPQEKLERLRKLRQAHGSVRFVGDGINDAPVLAGADVGAAMGSGADAAIEAADVVFMTSQTAAIPRSLDIARKTGQIALQNVVFALAVKGLVMILGLLGMASMWAAVFADSGVAMLCVLNSIRLLYQKK